LKEIEKILMEALLKSALNDNYIDEEEYEASLRDIRKI